jgi:hypothetical protein
MSPRPTLRLIDAAREHKRALARERQARARALQREGRAAYTVKPKLGPLFDALSKSGLSDEELARRSVVEGALTEAIEAWAAWRLAQK